MASPSPSFLSVASQTSGVLKKLDAAAPGRAFEQLSKVNRMNGSRAISRWSGAFAVNTTHRLPQPTEKAVACFYVHYNCSTDPHKPSYYRAVYLTERTIEDCHQMGHRPYQSCPHYTFGPWCIGVEVDDDVIRELREGQDMRLEIEETTGLPKPTKRKRGVLNDDDETSKEPVSSTTKGLVLRLFY